MSKKTKMYKRSHIRDRKRQQDSRRTNKEQLQNEMERLWFALAFSKNLEKIRTI